MILLLQDPVFHCNTTSAANATQLEGLTDEGNNGATLSHEKVPAINVAAQSASPAPSQPESKGAAVPDGVVHSCFDSTPTTVKLGWSSNKGEPKSAAPSEEVGTIDVEAQQGAAPAPFSASPAASPLRNGTVVHDAIVHCDATTAARDNLDGTLKKGECIQVTVGGSMADEDVDILKAPSTQNDAHDGCNTAPQELEFPGTGSRIEINGKFGYVFSVASGKQPNNSCMVGIAFDGDPILWDRIDMAERPRVKWSMLIGEEVTREAVHNVMRSVSGLRLPEAYLLGPSVMKVISEPGAPMVGWMLFAAYTPAVQTLSGRLVSKPKQMSAFRMGDHVYYNDIVAIALDSNETIESIKGDGAALFYGIALGKESNNVRRYVILRDIVDSQLCLTSLECIRRGRNEIDFKPMREDLGSQQATLQDILDNKLHRSPSAANSAMDRKKKSHAAEQVSNKQPQHEVSVWCVAMCVVLCVHRSATGEL